MKKYLFVLIAVAISFAVVSCGGNTNKKQEPAAQNVPQKVEANAAMPANVNDLLENYMGTYEGIIPCADCSGIDTKLTLNSDYTYSMTATYQGKEKDNAFENKGKWKINESLDVITLDFDKPKELTYYRIVNNNTLQLLDTEGKEISSSHNYYLTK